MGVSFTLLVPASLYLLSSCICRSFLKVTHQNEEQAFTYDMMEADLKVELHFLGIFLRNVLKSSSPPTQSH